MFVYLRALVAVRVATILIFCSIPQLISSGLTVKTLLSAPFMGSLHVSLSVIHIYIPLPLPCLFTFCFIYFLSHFFLLQDFLLYNGKQKLWHTLGKKQPYLNM